MTVFIALHYIIPMIGLKRCSNCDSFWEKHLLFEFEVTNDKHYYSRNIKNNSQIYSYLIFAQSCLNLKRFINITKYYKTKCCTAFIKSPKILLLILIFLPKNLRVKNLWPVIRTITFSNLNSQAHLLAQGAELVLISVLEFINIITLGLLLLQYSPSSLGVRIYYLIYVYVYFCIDYDCSILTWPWNPRETQNKVLW